MGRVAAYRGLSVRFLIVKEPDLRARCGLAVAHLRPRQAERRTRRMLPNLRLVSSCINERMVYSAMHEGPQHCIDTGRAG
jgi:hypothetical protein